MQWQKQALFYLSAVLLVAGCAGSQPERPEPTGSGVLTIEMDGFRNDTGQAVVSLFAGPREFPDGTEGVRMATVPIAKGKARAVFGPLPWGEYAVSVLHDEDGDGKMARSLLGIPKEGHGASNNPQKRFGPPDYEEARFLLVAPERTITIHVRYFQRLGGPPGGRRG